MSVQEIFAQNMRIYRMREGLSQEGLAEKCGLHRTYIGSIEQKKSNITLDTMQKIAKALDVSPGDLLEDPSPLDTEDNTDSDPENPYGKRRRYALYSWSDDEQPQFTPIDVKDEDLTLRILCALVQEGHTDDLASAYKKVQEPIIKYLQDLKNDK